jgi:phage tail-like protein
MSLVNPIPVFNFSVFLMSTTTGSSLAATVGAFAGALLGPVLVGTFSEVSGLNAEMETEEYREGGRNSGPLKFVKWGKYPNLVFKRGVTPNTDIWDWYYQVLYGNQSVLRKNGIVILNDHGSVVSGLAGVPVLSGLPGLIRIPIAIWSFKNGLPEKLQGPGLNAKGNEIAIETLEIAHEGLTRLGPGMLPGIGNVAASVNASI